MLGERSATANRLIRGVAVESLKPDILVVAVESLEPEILVEAVKSLELGVAVKSLKSCCDSKVTEITCGGQVTENEL